MISPILITFISQDVHIIAESLAKSFSGNYVVDKLEQWFNERIGYLNLLVMTSLNIKNIIGLFGSGGLVLEKFYYRMETLYLGLTE